MDFCVVFCGIVMSGENSNESVSQSLIQSWSKLSGGCIAIYVCSNLLYFIVSALKVI